MSGIKRWTIDVECGKRRTFPLQFLTTVSSLSFSSVSSPPTCASTDKARSDKDQSVKLHQLPLPVLAQLVCYLPQPKAFFRVNRDLWNVCGKDEYIRARWVAARVGWGYRQPVTLGEENVGVAVDSERPTHVEDTHSPDLDVRSKAQLFLHMLYMACRRRICTEGVLTVWESWLGGGSDAASVLQEMRVIAGSLRTPPLKGRDHDDTHVKSAEKIEGSMVEDRVKRPVERPWSHKSHSADSPDTAIASCGNVYTALWCLSHGCITSVQRVLDVAVGGGDLDLALNVVAAWNELAGRKPPLADKAVQTGVHSRTPLNEQKRSGSSVSETICLPLPLLQHLLKVDNLGIFIAVLPHLPRQAPVPTSLLPSLLDTSPRILSYLLTSPDCKNFSLDALLLSLVPASPTVRERVLGNVALLQAVLENQVRMCSAAGVLLRRAAGDGDVETCNWLISAGVEVDDDAVKNAKLAGKSKCIKLLKEARRVRCSKGY
ncbi:hypothetical protein BC832DRAFT_537307 [Gaertneriomyces semiglobifer]|nr:hypothetical protein BC832DRAFT_537307 [Gaertneriomyces semiglobifer]